MFRLIALSLAIGCGTAHAKNYTLQEFDLDGIHLSWEVTSAQLSAQPQWQPGRELPLSVNKAIALARVALLKDGYSSSSKVVSLGIASTGSDALLVWYYVVRFSTVDHGEVGLPKTNVVLLLMDGSVIVPKVGAK